MELLSGDRLGKYEVIGRLAAGGMAEVYLARIRGHGGFAKAVALKRMLPALACEPGFREMFMQEASLAARLSHPHVVQIFDFAEERGELYLAMEFVHGVNLRQLHADAIKRRRGDPSLRIPPMLAASIALGVARALSYAWTLPDEKGAPLHLIHRDVSPHNVLLSWQGDVKLADFGIAKPAEAHTSVGTLKGKLLYMPPEQLLGGPLDARSDLFALGIVLWETALGHRPVFDGRDEETVKKAIKERAVIPPVRVDPDFPPMLSDVIMKALERDPERRFQSGAEFADALGECLHREAQSPHEYDLPAFMTRMYGEPPPLRGINTPESASAVASHGPADPERVAEDGAAATLQRQKAAAAEGPVDSARRPTIPMEGPFEPAAPEKRHQRTTVKDRGLPRRDELQAAVQAALEKKASLGPEPALTRRPTSRVAKLVVAAGASALLAMGLTWAGLSSHSPRSAPPPAPEEKPGALAAEPQPPPAAADASQATEPPPQLAANVPGERPVVATAPTSGSPQREPEPTVSAPAEEKPAAPLVPAKGATVATATPSAARPLAAAPRTPKPVRKGTLVVHIRPWGHAWVDAEPFTGGVDQEAAPRLTRQLTAGKHVVHLKDGEGREKAVDVLVPADRDVTIEGTFEKFSIR